MGDDPQSMDRSHTSKHPRERIWFWQFWTALCPCEFRIMSLLYLILHFFTLSCILFCPAPYLCLHFGFVFLHLLVASRACWRETREIRVYVLRCALVKFCLPVLRTVIYVRMCACIYTCVVFCAYMCPCTTTLIYVCMCACLYSCGSVYLSECGKSHPTPMSPPDLIDLPSGMDETEKFDIFG